MMDRYPLDRGETKRRRDLVTESNKTPTDRLKPSGRSKKEYPVTLQPPGILFCVSSTRTLLFEINKALQAG